MFYKLFAIVIVSALIAGVAFSEDEEKARILAKKSVLNNVLVEGKELTVEYILYNVGSGAAYEVQLQEPGFPEDSFEVTQGTLSPKWNRIGPNTNVTHVVVLKPLFSGSHNFSAASLSYLPSETANNYKEGYTSALGQGFFMDHKEYDRKFSGHVLDWSAFVIMTLPSLAIPYLLWHSSKSKYDAPKLAKKN